MAVPVTTTIQNQIANLYISIMGRDPEPGGFAFWVSRLANENGTAAALTAITLEFGNSPEFARTYGGQTTQNAVSLMYEYVLDRQADVGGLNFWTQRAQSFMAAGYTEQQALALTGNQIITTAQNNGTQDSVTIAQKLAVAVASGTAPPVFNLTTNQDIATSTAFLGTFGNASFDGSAATLQGFDQLTGKDSTPGAINTLTIIDGFGSGPNIMPAGLTLNNIQTITLNTAGNAGQTDVSDNNTNDEAAYSTFNTSTFQSVTSTVVISTGATDDFVQASGLSDITVTHNALDGEVATYGGRNVRVVTAGDEGVDVGGFAGGATTGGYPTGDVFVTSNAYSNEGSLHVDVHGGVNVTVNLTQSGNDGDIMVGHDGTSSEEMATMPSGNVTVTTAGEGNIFVRPSETTDFVRITAAGGSEIEVGSDGNPHTAEVRVDNNASETSVNGIIRIQGGTKIDVTTNLSDVDIGGYISDTFEVNDPVGDITVTSVADTQGDRSDIEISGGARVTVTAANAIVQIGSSENWPGATSPTGEVRVTQTTAVEYDWSSDSNNNDLGEGTYNGLTNGFVSINGGTTTTVNALGQNVFIGSLDSTAADASVSTVTVTSAAVLTGSNGVANGQGQIVINGGTTVNVNTTGGEVFVGFTVDPDGEIADSGTAASGNVNITNTFSGPNTDDIIVLGGDAISITTTATTFGSGGLTYIDVGTFDSIELNAAGTALRNPTHAATGNVSITSMANQGVFIAGDISWAVFADVDTPALVNTLYGKGEDLVFVNGSDEVSITGASSALITDVQDVLATGGTGAGDTVGSGTLTTVNLTGINAAEFFIPFGIVEIRSNSLETLNVTDSSMALFHEQSLENTTALTVNLSDTVLGFETNSGAQSIRVNSDTLDSAIGLASANITTVNFNNQGTLFFLNGSESYAPGDSGGFDLESLTTINATGSGTLNLGSTANFSTVTSILAASATGAVNVALDQDDTSFAGGSGSDTVTLMNFDGSDGKSIAGGTGLNDTLVVNYNGGEDDDSFGSADLVSGFETLRFGTISPDPVDYFAEGDFDVTGYTNLEIASLADSIRLSNVATASVITFLGSLNILEPDVFLDLATSNSSLILNLGTVGGGTNIGTAGGFQILDASDTEGSLTTVSIVSNGTSSGNSINLKTDGELTALNLSGAVDLRVLTQEEFDASVTTINASQSSGDIDVTEVNLDSESVTVTGGAGQISVNLMYADSEGSSNSNSDTVATVTSGTGGVDLQLGLGGSWNSANESVVYNDGIDYPDFDRSGALGLETTFVGENDTGSQTIDLSAAVAASSTIRIDNSYTTGSGSGDINYTDGQYAEVDGFKLVGSSAADVVTWTGNQNENSGIVYQINNSAGFVGGASGSPDNQLASVYALGLNGDTALATAITENTLTYTVKNGVISFGGTAASTLSASDLLKAAQIVVNMDSNDSDTAALVNIEGDAFVISAINNGAIFSNGGSGGSSSEVEDVNATAWQIGGTVIEYTTLAQINVAVTDPGIYSGDPSDFANTISSTVTITYDGVTTSFTVSNLNYFFENGIDADTARNASNTVAANLAEIASDINDYFDNLFIAIGATASETTLSLTGLQSIYAGMDYTQSNSSPTNNNDGFVSAVSSITGATVTVSNTNSVVTLLDNTATGFGGYLDVVLDLESDYYGVSGDFYTSVGGATGAVASDMVFYQQLEGAALSNTSATTAVAGGFTWVTLSGANEGPSTTAWTSTRTVSGLASYGVIEFDGEGSAQSQGNLMVTQQANTGQALVLGSSDGTTRLTTVTTTGNWATGIQGSFVIGNLVDSTNTTTNLYLNNKDDSTNSNVRLSQITLTSLNVLDASNISGDLVLGGTGYAWTNNLLNNFNVAGLSDLNGVEFILGTGTNNFVNIRDTGLTITDSGASQNYIQTYGANNTITLGEDASSEVLANGADNTITINAFDESTAVEAAGARTVFNINTGDGSNTYISGLNFMYTAAQANSGSGDFTNESFMTSVGADAIFNLTDGDSEGSNANTWTWLGDRNTVNVGDASTGFSGYLNLLVEGATVDNLATPNMTVINIADGMSIYDFILEIDFGNEITIPVDISTNFGDALINVSVAATIAEALDIAASQGALANQGNSYEFNDAVLFADQSVVTWFQFEGDTYIVEANNTTNQEAAHDGLQVNDVVIQLTGLVDLSEFVLTGNTLIYSVG